MTRHYTGRRTTGTSALFQTIAKDFQGLKTSKEIKIPQKYLDRKDNFWSKMHSRGVTTYPVYRKLKRLTYAKKCKPTPKCSPPTITHYNLHNKMMTKTLLWTFLIFVQSVLCLCTFSSPPFPAYHIISFPSSLAKLKQCFLWTKYTNAKDIPYPLGPKQVLNTFLQRISTRSAFAEKNIYVMSPLWLSRGPGRDRCLDNQKKIC